MTQWHKRQRLSAASHGYDRRAHRPTTGMIDAPPTTPLASMSFQWFKQTPYMLDPASAPSSAPLSSTRRRGMRFRRPTAPNLRDFLKVEKQLQADVPKGDGLCHASDAEPGAQGHQGRRP